MAQLPITDATYDTALEEVDQLMRRYWRTPDEGLAEQLDQLAEAIEAYEEFHFPFPKPTPAEVLQHLIEERGQPPEQFAAAVGLPAEDITSILSGRDITAEQAALLGKFFAMDPSLFQ